jgi:hypothetical protein
MQEGHGVAPRAGTRRTIDEPYAGGLETTELALDVVGAVRDMMESRTAPFEEAADRGFGAERLQELGRPDESDADTLGGERLGTGTGFAGEEFDEATGLFDGVDRERHVIEAMIARWDIHGSWATSSGRGRRFYGRSASKSYEESRDGNE